MYSCFWSVTLDFTRCLQQHAMYSRAGVCGEFIILENIPKHVWQNSLNINTSPESVQFLTVLLLLLSLKFSQQPAIPKQQKYVHLSSGHLNPTAVFTFLFVQRMRKKLSIKCLLKKRKDRGTPQQGLDSAAFLALAAEQKHPVATLFIPFEAASEFLALPA